MKLSVQIEFDKTLELTTKKTKVTVGRAPNCDLVIPHNSISRNHCQIEYTPEGEFFITDTGSSNGSFINGDKLHPHVRSAYLLENQLVLGKLDCEISMLAAPTEDQTRTHLHAGLQEQEEASSTVRVARLDLNKPSITLKMEKEVKVKGPRNPITDELQHPKKNKKSKVVVPLILLMVITVVQVFLINMAMN